MSTASVPLASFVSLGDSLTALVHRLQADTARQHSALYFDYMGLTMFPEKDVLALTPCVEEMVRKGLDHAEQGQGSVFLNVHAWPLSTDKARVTVQVAYTASASARDLGTLSSMVRQPAEEGPEQCPAMSFIEKAGLLGRFSEGVDAHCVQHLSPSEGAVIELSLSLPHPGPEVEPPSLTELATVSAWLVGRLSEDEALLAIRLQRDGWLVRQFADLEQALAFKASSDERLEPALVVAAEQGGVSLPAMLQARQAWSPQCRMVYGVHTDRLDGAPDVPGARGVERWKMPFSPADLRTLKEGASSLEASRKEDAEVTSRDGSRSRPTALVVDDGLVNRVLATEMLHVLGYDADTAENGREAVEYLERYHTDVVLMDLEMPVMDGMEATERIRRYEMHGGGAYPSVPIIATTARDERDVSKSWEAIGMTAFVPKPLMMDRLSAALSAHRARF